MRRSFLLTLTLGLAGCVGLRLTLVDSAYQRPSNVAVYFTVDAANGDPVGGLGGEFDFGAEKCSEGLEEFDARDWLEVVAAQQRLHGHGGFGR